MNKLAAFVASRYTLVAAVVVAVFAGACQLAGHPAIGHVAIIIYGGLIACMLAANMAKDILHGRYGVDILAVVAIISTLAIGEYWAAIVIVLMMTGGEALEAFANERAKAELTALLKRAPKTAHKVMVDGTTRDVPIDRVHKGDELLVRPGEVIPVDGVVVGGVSSLDESSITGESEPVDAKPGMQILSGAVNGSSPLTIKATHAAKDSQYEQIIQLVKAAGDSRAPFVRMADRYAVPFTVIAFTIAAAAWWVSGESRRFAEVLVVATPCPLLLAAPIALISGMSRAAKHGVIIKNGGILEKLATVHTAAFDKTGTLTNGQLVVDSISPTGKTTPNQLLQLAASAEQHSNHVTALALADRAKKQAAVLLPVTKSNEIPGDGITCTIGGKTILAGKRELLIKRGIAAESIPEFLQTATYVASGKKYLGAITFADTVRQDSGQTLAKLKTLGINNLLMITGDKQATAQKIADQLGIIEVHADCLPKDKLQIVKNYPERPVVMTGDGVNDAPVLAVSDVGIAMGARGATAASESADVVVMIDSISRVALVIAIAKRTIAIARQSVITGIVLSVGLMIVASFGVIPAVVGALLQELVDVVVIINALRAHISPTSE